MRVPQEGRRAGPQILQSLGYRTRAKAARSRGGAAHSSARGHSRTHRQDLCPVTSPGAPRTHSPLQTGLPARESNAAAMGTDLRDLLQQL